MSARGQWESYWPNIPAKRSLLAPLQAAPWRWCRVSLLWCEIPSVSRISVCISSHWKLYYFTFYHEQHREKIKNSEWPVVRIYSLKLNVLGFGMLCLNGCCPWFSSVNPPCACLQFGHSIAGAICIFPGQIFPSLGSFVATPSWSLSLCITARHVFAGKDCKCFSGAKQHTNSCACLNEPWELKPKLKFAAPKKSSFCTWSNQVLGFFFCKGSSLMFS